LPAIVRQAVFYSGKEPTTARTMSATTIITTTTTRRSNIKSNYKLILLTVRLLFRIVSFHCQLANARRNENGPNHQIVCQKMLEGPQMKGDEH